MSLSLMMSMQLLILDFPTGRITMNDIPNTTSPTGMYLFIIRMITMQLSLKDPRFILFYNPQMILIVRSFTWC
jgi:hypothetical protein